MNTTEVSWRQMSIKTFQRLATRVAELSTALSHVRVMHTNCADGLCAVCHVADCATSVAARDPRPQLRRRWVPVPRKDSE